MPVFARHLARISVAALLAAASGVAGAQTAEAQAPDVSGWDCKFCPFESGTSGWIEFGEGFLSDESSRFGRHTGINGEDPFFIGNAELRRRGDDVVNWTLDVRDVGLASRDLAFTAGRQGLFELDLGYRGLPRIRTENAETPFRGESTDTLTLPAGWDTAASTGAMTELWNVRFADLRVDRQRLDLGAAFHPTPRSNYQVRYRHETRSGTDAMGGAFLTKSALLPEPVDDSTDQMEVSTALALPAWQLRAAYHGSLYTNRNDALTWQNPYDPLSAGADQGRLALAPDNQAHHISTALAVQAVPLTSITGQLVFGRLLQEDRFIPATINPNLATALPRADAGGRVDTLDGALRSGTRLTPSTRLNLEYHYRDRDNVTPRALYPQIGTDVYTAESRVNRPYRFTDQGFGASVRQRLGSDARAAIGYDRDSHRRTLQSVDRTVEDTLWGRFDLQPIEQGDLEFRIAQGKRDGPVPHALDATAPPENPRLRRFHLADRTRTVTAVRWSGTATTAVTYGAGGEWASDEYTGTEVGVTEGRDFSLTADVAWAPSPEMLASVMAAHNRIRAEQAGSQSFAFADWSADSRDTTNTVGLNFERRNVVAALDLAATYTFAGSTGETRLNNAGQAVPFPDLTTTLHGFGVRGLYHVSPRATLTLGFRHEQYDADDWQLDGLDTATVPNLLATALEADDYRVNLVYLTAIWRLGAQPAGEESE